MNAGTVVPFRMVNFQYIDQMVVNIEGRKCNLFENFWHLTN